MKIAIESEDGAPRVFSAADVIAPGGHYAHAVVHKGICYISGQLGIKNDGSHTVGQPFEEQASQALTNVINVLRACGCTPSSVLKMTAYIVGTENWPSFDRIHAKLFGSARAARTVVTVPALHYGYLIEIDAIAARARG